MITDNLYDNFAHSIAVTGLCFTVGGDKVEDNKVILFFSILFCLSIRCPKMKINPNDIFLLILGRCFCEIQGIGPHMVVQLYGGTLRRVNEIRVLSTLKLLNDTEYIIVRLAKRSRDRRTENTL